MECKRKLVLHMFPEVHRGFNLQFYAKSGEGLEFTVRLQPLFY